MGGGSFRDGFISQANEHLVGLAMSWVRPTPSGVEMTGLGKELEGWPNVPRKTNAVVAELVGQRTSLRSCRRKWGGGLDY